MAIATVLLTTTSASPQTWAVPSDCPAGTIVTVEGWGAASGGSGGSTSFRAGGGGGSYASIPYTVTTADVTNGISYTIQAGSAGTAAANPTAGPDVLFGPTLKNLIQNSMAGAVVNGSLPTSFSFLSPNGLTITVAGMGTVAGIGLDAATLLPYVDLTIAGTTNATSQSDLQLTTNNLASASIPATASATYNFSTYLSATNQTGITGTFLQVNWGQANNAASFVSNTQYFGPAITSSWTQYSGHIAAPATAGCQNVYLRFSYNTGTSINFTLRIAGLQMEQASAATAVQLTPCYMFAKGGTAASGNTGGNGLNGGCSLGTTVFSGGTGATKTQGGGGGGSAGKVGSGASSTTGTGGTADAGSGGTAGVSNVEGGGGGTAATSSAPGGSPGGGGGANTSTGSGGNGGRAQLRLSYQSWIPTRYPTNSTMQPILAQ